MMDMLTEEMPTGKRGTVVENKPAKKNQYPSDVFEGEKRAAIYEENWALSLGLEKKRKKKTQEVAPKRVAEVGYQGGEVVLGNRSRD